jgi:hypothetical protein
MSERGAPMTAVAFRRMLTRLGQTARMPFGIHQHTVRYTELTPERFRDFWKD